MTIRSIIFLLVAVFTAACVDAGQEGGPNDVAADTSVWTFDLQGHRGARGLLPENTIPSFMRAIELGVHTVEMDLVVSADSHVVVSHEPWFSSEICSTPDGKAILKEEERSFNIYEMAYDSVRTFDCGSRGNPLFPEQESIRAHKPRFDSTLAVLERYAVESGLPPPHYNVEIKSRPGLDGTFTPAPETFARLVHRVVAEQGVKDRTIIQSFDPRSLSAMRKIDAGITLALLVENDLGFDTNVERLGFMPDVYSPHQRLVNEDVVRAAHGAGILVIPWTVNDAPAMRRLLRMGVDGIITDYPDRAAALRTTEAPMP